jgi:hypothetical protein
MSSAPVSARPCVELAAVAVERAHALCRNAERRLSKMLTRFEPVTERAGIDIGSLYDGNLISGVVSGLDRPQP